jgi:hypothetical protein
MDEGKSQGRHSKVLGGLWVFMKTEVIQPEGQFNNSISL